jgi:hypothetical protein
LSGHPIVETYSVGPMSYVRAREFIGTLIVQRSKERFMIRLSAVALVLALFGLSSAVYAAESTSTPKMVTCKDGTKSEAGQGACSHHGGVVAHKKMVTCTDGTKSEAGQGACSHHGGVKPKTTSTSKPATKPASKPATSGTSSGSSAAHGGAAATDTGEPKAPSED